MSRICRCEYTRSDNEKKNIIFWLVIFGHCQLTKENCEVDKYDRLSSKTK